MAAPLGPAATGPQTAAAQEAGARRCRRHPGRETWVSCGRCGRPFCPECLVHTPAGQRCFDCAGVRRDAAQRAAAAGLLKAAGAAAVGAAIAGLAGLLLSLLAALVSGSVAGQALAPAVNRKTRRALYALGLLAIAGGALLGSIIVGMIRTAPLPVPFEVRLFAVALNALESLTVWLFVGLAAAIAYQRMR